MSHHRKTLKIVILGDSGVGKTSLMNRYSTGKFTGQYKATIGADFLSKDNVIVTDPFGQRQLVTLQIWDTAGQERFQSLGVGFYRGADACMLVYDITDPHSLDNLNHWKTEFETQVGGGLAGLSETSVPFVVVGNKMDKSQDRLVTREMAMEYCWRANAQSMNHHQPLPHFETSAKTAENVEEAFMELSRRGLLYEEYKRRSQPQLFIPPSASNEPISLNRNGQSGHRTETDRCC